MVYHHGGGTSGGEFSPLAVRLRTRNSILLIIKCLPGWIMLRCIFPIIFAQLFWLARVLANRRLWSYLRGLAGVLPRVRAMLLARGPLSHVGRRPARELWEAILRSEAQARRDVSLPAGENQSLFLKWYFKLF